MSYCEADNVVMIQSLSFSELCVSILSPVNLTQSLEEQGGRRGKIFYISWQPKPLNITWMDQTGGKIISWSAQIIAEVAKIPPVVPSWVAQCPVIPVTITMFSQPLLSKFFCITNRMIYSLLVQSRFLGKPNIKSWWLLLSFCWDLGILPFEEKYFEIFKCLARLPCWLLMHSR